MVATGKDLVNTLHKYYAEDSVSTSSDESQVQKIVKVLETKNEHDAELKTATPCRVCHGKNEKQDNYIILSCNHVFHISCLAESNMNDNRKFQMIEDEFFNSCHCLYCDKLMLTEELVFLYSKFYNGTKHRMKHHEESIEKLEAKMKQLKDELRACYEYKYKLEQERDKSKQYVAMLMTMM
jgi:hypothetical protein